MFGIYCSFPFPTFFCFAFVRLLPFNSENTGPVWHVLKEVGGGVTDNETFTATSRKRHTFVDSCPRTKLNGSLQRTADKAAVDWPTSYST